MRKRQLCVEMARGGGGTHERVEQLRGHGGHVDSCGVLASVLSYFGARGFRSAIAGQVEMTGGRRVRGVQRCKDKALVIPEVLLGVGRQLQLRAKYLRPPLATSSDRTSRASASSGRVRKAKISELGR